MKCERCGSATGVIDSRRAGESIRRRRQCLNKMCATRFSTYEIRCTDAMSELLWRKRPIRVVDDTQYKSLVRAHEALGKVKELLR